MLKTPPEMIFQRLSLSWSKRTLTKENSILFRHCKMIFLPYFIYFFFEIKFIHQILLCLFFLRARCRYWNSNLRQNELELNFPFSFPTHKVLFDWKRWFSNQMSLRTYVRMYSKETHFVFLSCRMREEHFKTKEEDLRRRDHSPRESLPKGDNLE